MLLSTTSNGVLVYDSVNNTTGRTCGNIDFSDLPAKGVNSLSMDREGNIWVSTFDKGVITLANHSGMFSSGKGAGRWLRDEFVTRIQPGRSGSLWIGTRYNGLIYYDPDVNDIKYFNSMTMPALRQFGMDFVQSLLLDSKGRIWLGYNNSTIVCGYKGSAKSGMPLTVLSRFPRLNGAVSFCEDKYGRVWAASGDRGLALVDSSLRVVDSIAIPRIKSNNITKVTRLDDDHMLISAYSDKLYKVDVNTMDITPFLPEYSQYWMNAIDMIADRDNNIWVGTYSHGMVRVDGTTQQVSRFRSPQIHDIVALLEDRNGEIWASSSYGLYRFDKSGRLLNSYYKGDGLGGNQFHEKCKAILDDGRMMFGGNSGLEEINPELKTGNVDIIPLHMTGIWTVPDNKTLLTGDNATKSESAVEEVELTHEKNSISIDFFGCHYADQRNVEYSCMLKGRDKDFIDLGNFRRATYSDLRPGKYEFYVKSRLKDNQWQEPVKLLDINVKPSPWLATPMLIMYFILVAGIIVISIRLYVRFYELKRANELTQDRINQVECLTANRINFFTNISHELRTPLTLICGPVKRLKSNYRTMNADQIDESLMFIESNVDRMMTLIRQLLSFRQASSDTLPMKVSESDLVRQLESLTKLYSIYAGEHGLTICFKPPVGDSQVQAVYDIDKIEKIISNLIVNAIKYSDSGGEIILSLDFVTKPEGISDDKGYAYAEISVSDCGRGIKEEDIPKIFQRFKRVLRTDESLGTEGFGIGLNFVEHLVREHKGIIRAKRNARGGMTFTVVIPVSAEAYPDSGKNVVALESVNRETADAEAGQTVHDDSRPRMLVVEDNEELNRFIAGIFAGQFQVTQVYNGDDGLEKARELCPDIVISDVHMPGDTDGFELCRQLKADHTTCHTPVILLTAKALDEHKIQGYECGADGYMCKPFSPDVLLARLNNLQKKLAQQRAEILAAAGSSSDVNGSEEPQVAQDISPLDKKFLEKLYSYIETSIDNSDINVNLLGRELGFSRTNFYRKVKALTGVAPNDLLRVYRLNRAAELLLTREYTIGEVADRTGFTNQSHFSALFKKHFGMSPRSYVASHFSTPEE